MGRKTITDPAAEFREWLIYDCDSPKGVRTADTYASNVRRFAALLGEISDTQSGPQSFWRHIVDAEKVRAAVDRCEPARISRLRTPWRSFVEWGKTKGLTIAALPEVEGASRTTVGIPEDVIDAVHYLSSRRMLTLELIASLRWSEVEEKAGRCHVHNLLDNSFVRVPAEVVKALRNYAAPGDGSVPLIPREPGGRLPLGLRSLGNHVRAYRKRMGLTAFESGIAKKVEEARQRRQSDGSALGASGGKAPAQKAPAVTAETYQIPSRWQPKSNSQAEDDLASLMAFDPEAVD